MCRPLNIFIGLLLIDWVEVRMKLLWRRLSLLGVRLEGRRKEYGVDDR